METAADWALLRMLGCDLAQGYLFAKPMPAGDIVGWVKHNRARLPALATDAVAMPDNGPASP